MLNVFSPLYPYSRNFSCAHCPFFVCGIKQKSEQFDLRVIRVTKMAPHTQKNLCIFTAINQKVGPCPPIKHPLKALVGHQLIFCNLGLCSVYCTVYSVQCVLYSVYVCLLVLQNTYKINLRCSLQYSALYLQFFFVVLCCRMA